MTAIWWLRRDLRLHDNAALTAALRATTATGGAVVPVFVLDPAALASRWHAQAARRQAFLFAGLRALDAELRARGSRLVLRAGAPTDVIPALVAETGATTVIAEADHSPFARRRDAEVARHAPLTLVGSPAIRAPSTVRKPDGSSYVVFGAFRRAWLALEPLAEALPVPRVLPSVPAALASAPLPEAAPPAAFPAGEAEARARLDRFTRAEDAAIFRYADERDRPDLDGTSALSPYLRFGMLSPREAATRALEAEGRAADEAGRAGAGRWLDELIWRDFYLGVLDAFPRVTREAFDARLRGIAWRNDPDDLAAWRAGRTGFPIVDAAMRQLAATGWMHNRCRMIVASFLVKHLLCDWRLGEQWFMEQLVDGDVASNNGGWQWTAGVGTDAAPYFRVFNPLRQGERFDPHGDYVRRWVPELEGSEARHAHEPWRMSAAQQEAAGVRIGVGYPARIVDLDEGRARALAAYAAARAEAG
ncbi:MAG: deoxyribodipyrimidine photo-lyase [Dehalococcoidia bacterium]